MVNRDEPLGQRLGRLPGSDEIDQLPRPGHRHGIGCDQGVALGPTRPVERLDDEKSNPQPTIEAVSGSEQIESTTDPESGV